MSFLYIFIWVVKKTKLQRRTVLNRSALKRGQTKLQFGTVRNRSEPFPVWISHASGRNRSEPFCTVSKSSTTLKPEPFRTVLRW